MTTHNFPKHLEHDMKKGYERFNKMNEKIKPFTKKRGVIVQNSETKWKYSADIDY